jgi:hypothetical protein
MEYRGFEIEVMQGIDRNGDGLSGFRRGAGKAKRASGMTPSPPSRRQLIAPLTPSATAAAVENCALAQVAEEMLFGAPSRQGQ